MDLFISIRNKKWENYKISSKIILGKLLSNNEEYFWSGVMGRENPHPMLWVVHPWTTSEIPLNTVFEAVRICWSTLLSVNIFIHCSFLHFGIFKATLLLNWPSKWLWARHSLVKTAAFWLTCHCLFPLEKSLQIRVCKLSLQQFKTDNWIMCATDSLVGKEFTPQHILAAERAPVSVTLLAAVLTVKELPLYSSTVIKFLQRPWLINQIFIHLCKYRLNREYPQSWASQHKCSFMWACQSPENMRSCFAFLMPRVLQSSPSPKNRTQVILLMASVTQPQLKLLHYGFIPSF